MKNNRDKPKEEIEKGNSTRKLYYSPELRIYGQLQRLTANISAVSGEGSSGMGMAN